MFILTQKAILVCAHEIGIVQIAALQDLVAVEGTNVLVERDPEGRPIVGCPMYGAGIKPCITTP